MPSLQEVQERQRIAEAELLRIETEKAEALERQVQEAKSGHSPNGVPLPPSNQTEAALSEADQRFLRVTRMMYDPETRKEITYADAKWVQQNAFAELMRSYGNDPDFHPGPNMKKALQNVRVEDFELRTINRPRMP